MADIHDAVDFKWAKIVVNDMDKLIPQLEELMIKASPYWRYTPISQFINAKSGLRDTILICKTYRDYQKKVLETKGKKEEPKSEGETPNE